MSNIRVRSSGFSGLGYKASEVESVGLELLGFRVEGHHRVVKQGGSRVTAIPVCYHKRH